MPSLDQFGDFLIGTGELSVKGPRGLNNEATEHTYYVSRWMAGRSNKQLRQGGSRLRTEQMFNEQNTAEFYTPATPRSHTNPQVMSQSNVDWRFLRDDMNWEEQELLLNDSGDDLFQQFDDLAFKLEMRVTTSTINKMEQNFWEEPVESEMEAQGGIKPYAVHAFVNMGSAVTSNTTVEYQSSQDGTSAGYNNGLFDNGNGVGWSTKAGIDPSTANGRWEAAFRTYRHANSANPTDAFDGTAGSGDIDDEYGLLAALDDMYLDVQYQRPPSFSQYFNNPSLYGQHVCASKRGVNQYKRLLRASNDTLAMGHQDSGYNNPTVYGIDMLYISRLNDAAVFLNGNDSGLVSENAGTAQGGTATDAEMWGPAYFFLDSNHYFPVFHAQRYMHRKKPMNDRERPESWTVPVISYYNQVPCSLRRLGLVKGDFI